MPRGRPNADHGGDPKSNKMEAVRQAMTALGDDASPNDIQAYVKEKFGQDIHTNMVSSYKSAVRKKLGLRGRRRKRGRPRKTEAAAVHAAPAAMTSHEGISWKDIRAIKDVAGRIGKKGLKELVELLD